MDTTDLATRKCVPCERGVPKLEPARISALTQQVPGWRVEDERLVRAFTFANFTQAMQFVNRMAELAEAEGHHPDFCVHYSRVDVTTWTHAYGPRGLSENDLILAAKIDRVL